MLLIEDCAVQAKLLAHLCACMGVPASHRPDATTIADDLAALRPPAVITDLCLPGPDGTAVLEAVAAVDRDMPVMVVSAEGPEELARALDRGIALGLRALQICPKPVPVTVLSRFVGAATARGQAGAGATLAV